MRWIQRYRLAHFLRSAHWLTWLASVLLAMVLTPVLRRIDQATHWQVLEFGLDGSRALLATLAGSMLSLLVFVLSALLIAVQIASAQLTPRVIAVTIMRRGPVRYTIGLVVFTFLLSVGVLGRTEDSVLQLSTATCLAAGLLSIACFLFVIDFALKALRPVSVVATVADEGALVITDVYPDLLGAAVDRRRSARRELPPSPGGVVLQTGDSGVLTAADMAWLASTATDAGGLVELVPRVGEFVAEGNALFQLHGGAARLDGHALRSALAFESERTMEQDPMFAFRILVDIASKALSPAINDPTTAVLSLDQIHRLLRSVGRRHLDTEAMLDEALATGLVFHTPDWEDYVVLAVSEVRQFGAGSIQVVRRLRAMLENLIASLPEIRRPALEAQLRMVDRSVGRDFPDALFSQLEAGIGKELEAVQALLKSGVSSIDEANQAVAGPFRVIDELAPKLAWEHLRAKLPSARAEGTA